MQEANYLTNLFELSIQDYNIPLIFLNHLQRRNELSKELLKFVLPDLRQILIFKNYFLRYDLTLPFLLSKYQERAQYGPVYRIGPQSKFRQIQFIQADIDVIYSKDKVLQYLNFIVNFLNKLSLKFVIKYNHLVYLAQFANLQLSKLKVWQKSIDEGGHGYLEIYRTKIKDRIVAQYGPLFLQPLFVCDPTIVRGLHMYTQLVFEVYVVDLPYAIGAGGTYCIPHIKDSTFFGVSLGISRINTYLKTYFEPIPIIVFKKMYKQIPLYIYLTDLLYYRVIIVKTNLKRILQKLKVQSTVIILGSKEIEQNCYRVKNLVDCKQIVIPINTIDTLWNYITYTKKN